MVRVKQFVSRAGSSIVALALSTIIIETANASPIDRLHRSFVSGAIGKASPLPTLKVESTSATKATTSSEKVDPVQQIDRPEHDELDFPLGDEISGGERGNFDPAVGLQPRGLIENMFIDAFHLELLGIDPAVTDKDPNHMNHTDPSMNEVKTTDDELALSDVPAESLTESTLIEATPIETKATATLLVGPSPTGTDLTKTPVLTTTYISLINATVTEANATETSVTKTNLTGPRPTDSAPTEIRLIGSNSTPSPSIAVHKRDTFEVKNGPNDSVLTVSGEGIISRNEGAEEGFFDRGSTEAEKDRSPRRQGIRRGRGRRRRQHGTHTPYPFYSETHTRPSEMKAEDDVTTPSHRLSRRDSGSRSGGHSKRHAGHGSSKSHGGDGSSRSSSSHAITSSHSSSRTGSSKIDSSKSSSKESREESQMSRRQLIPTNVNPLWKSSNWTITEEEVDIYAARHQREHSRQSEQSLNGTQNEGNVADDANEDDEDEELIMMHDELLMIDHSVGGSPAQDQGADDEEKAAEPDTIFIAIEETTAVLAGLFSNTTTNGLNSSSTISRNTISNKNSPATNSTALSPIFATTSNTTFIPEGPSPRVSTQTIPPSTRPSSSTTTTMMTNSTTTINTTTTTMDQPLVKRSHHAPPDWLDTTVWWRTDLTWDQYGTYADTVRMRVAHPISVGHTSKCTLHGQWISSSSDSSPSPSPSPSPPSEPTNDEIPIPGSYTCTCRVGTATWFLFIHAKVISCAARIHVQPDDKGIAGVLAPPTPRQIGVAWEGHWFRKHIPDAVTVYPFPGECWGSREECAGYGVSQYSW
ncbi:MAG: hypothetical protein M1825_000348 [Sarcosagium campestre]|nr:MAG: hypothetical protein M1825_000348 [Sarcosagium campestre]